MPNPKSILSFYPPTELEKRIDDKKPKTLHVYIDLKNIMVSLFVPEIVEQIMANSKTMGNIDSSILQSIIIATSYWRKLAQRKGMNIRIFICADTGESIYHTEIHKNYKANRKISKDGIISCQEIKDIRDRNFNIADKLINKIPHVYFFCLKFLEADFLPYYLITKYFKNKDHIYHVVLSGDKDLYQNMVVGEDVVQIYKLKQVKYLLDESQILLQYSKPNKASLKTQSKHMKNLELIDPKYITAMMACVGDASDDIPGVAEKDSEGKTIVSGVGAISTLEMFSNKKRLERLIGTPEELDDRIHSGGLFVKEEGFIEGLKDKKWAKVIKNNDKATKAYKMISFEQLSRWVSDKNSLPAIKHHDYILKILKKDGIGVITEPNTFIKPFQKLEDNYLTEQDVVPLFT